jgi:hypothetical protein
MRSLLIIGAGAALVAGCGDAMMQPETPPPAGAIALSVGETRDIAPADAATIQVSGGSSGAEFVLVPFYASQAPSATVALEFSGEQLREASGPPSSDVAPAASQSGPTFDRAASLSVAARASFDARLRRAERALAPRIPAARAAWAAREAARKSSGAPTSAAAAPPAVGDAVTYNVAESSCDAPDYRSGHVVAISADAVVVADDANPPGGFTSGQYARIARAFTDSVYPLDTRNFGTPSDIDANGRVVIFFTRAVNELTPPSVGWYIGGFFHPRDLFPKAAANPAHACAASNEAEMFYMLVPDPTGVVHGNRRPLEAVETLTTGVLAHEFQHLINAARRLYVNNAASFEEVWLNEGLSHIAEELMFYQAPGFAPRQNLTRQRVGASQMAVDAFNAYEVANFGRLFAYLQDPERNSPHADNDNLATRGATWQLLRYAADHSTKTDEQVWRGLVRDTKLSGFANLTAVFGDVMPLVRDWSTAQYTDDLVLQTTATLQQPSWDYRSLFSALLPNGYGYPLKTRALASGAPVSLTLNGGSAAYVRFAVAGRATGAVHVTSGGAAPPAAVALTLVRTR